ncbi:hypothetical protein B0H13DRAFT_1883599 [Mycena leptocephala]|nr:hypothetical protein B0H13DRAFT_1883599 [Mycena leptocephala]
MTANPLRRRPTKYRQFADSRHIIGLSANDLTLPATTLAGSILTGYTPCSSPAEHLFQSSPYLLELDSVLPSAAFSGAISGASRGLLKYLALMSFLSLLQLLVLVLFAQTRAKRRFSIFQSDGSTATCAALLAGFDSIFRVPANFAQALHVPTRQRRTVPPLRCLVYF